MLLVMIAHAGRDENCRVAFGCVASVMFSFFFAFLKMLHLPNLHLRVEGLGLQPSENKYCNKVYKAFSNSYFLEMYANNNCFNIYVRKYLWELAVVYEIIIFLEKVFKI